MAMVEHEYPAEPIDFERRSKDPASWHSVGISLYVAADALWKQLRPSLQAWEGGEPLTGEQELVLRHRGPFAMLAGMAIEVMLKGSIVQAMPPRERQAPPLGHDLVDLSEAARIEWSDAQLDLLRRLTTFIKWAGRYPVAVTEERTQDPRILRSTDYLTIIEVAGHLSDIHLGRVK